MKRILVVDDSAIGREIVTKVLGPAYEVVKAASGEEALLKIGEITPDLVILDLLMPGMDGFAVLGRLKEAVNLIPVIVLSADIQKSTRTKVLDLGAVDMINKPVDPETLHSTVAALLGEHP